jgi:hypothetical protein
MTNWCEKPHEYSIYHLVTARFNEWTKPKSLNPIYHLFKTSHLNYEM